MSRTEKFRESVRFPAYRKAFYYLDGKKEGFDICNVLNISYGGVCIKLSSQDRITIGTKINFGLIYKWKPISVKGVFKWTRNVGKYYVGGIELTKALDVFTFIKCCNVGTSKREQEDHCNYFIRAFSKIKKCFAKNKRTIKEISHKEKVTCLINDYKIHTLGKIEYLEDQLDCIFKDSAEIAKGLNDVKVKLIRLKNSEENLKEKIIWNEKLFELNKNNRSLIHWNPANKEVKVFDIKRFKSKQLSLGITQPPSHNALPNVD